MTDPSLRDILKRCRGVTLWEHAVFRIDDKIPTALTEEDSNIVRGDVSLTTLTDYQDSLNQYKIKKIISKFVNHASTLWLTLRK